MPIFFVIVKPKRAVPPFSVAGRSRTSIRNAGVEERRPPRTARNSGRDLRVCRVGIRASRTDGCAKAAGSRDKMREQRRLYHGRFRRAVSGFVGMQDVAIAHANIRAGNSLQRVHNDQCLQVRAETRRTGACGPSRDGGRELSGHQPSACAYGSRGAACERCGSVDTCASRNSPSK